MFTNDTATTHRPPRSRERLCAVAHNSTVACTHYTLVYDVKGTTRLRIRHCWEASTPLPRDPELSGTPACLIERIQGCPHPRSSRCLMKRGSARLATSHLAPPSAPTLGQGRSTVQSPEAERHIPYPKARLTTCMPLSTTDPRGHPQH